MRTSMQKTPARHIGALAMTAVLPSGVMAQDLYREKGIYDA